MNSLRNFFSVSNKDIRKWDVGIAILIAFCIPILFFYKFFSSESVKFFSIKLKAYYDARYFTYHLFSKLALAFLLSIWLITSRRWWWFLICWPLFWYFNDFFYIFLRGLGWIKKSVSGFNLYGFLIFPLLYTLRKNYQKAYNQANPTELKYKKQSSILDIVAIWVLCFSVPFISIYLFFDPSLKLDFRLSFLLPASSMVSFVYDFFEKMVAVLLLLVWFFEAKRWWYFVIAWPILLHIFRWIHVFRHYLNINLIDPKFFYVGSFTLMIIYPIYKIRGYLQWDIFHDQFGKKKKFWSKFAYLLGSMTEYFVTCTSLILINLFISEELIYPLNLLLLGFLIVWFLFCRQWWYFLIAIPLIWYVLKVTNEGINDAFTMLVISFVSLYPIYRMRSYVYKEVLESPDKLERISLQEEKTHKFSRCLLKEKPKKS